MKKLYIIFLCLCTLLSLVSCNQNKMEEKECYISSPSLIYGDRIYQINTVEKENGQTGTYLTYQNIGNETEATHIGCIDPLCTHDYNVCTAVAYGTSEIVMIPGGKAPKIYFVANIKGDVCIVSLDMETGERKNVCILPEDYQPAFLRYSFIISGDYLYTIGKITDGSGGSSYDNIWRVSLSNGDFEKMTKAEEQNAYYVLYYVDDDGYHYYVRHINDSSYEHVFYRSRDFVNEQVLLDCTYTGEFPQNDVQYIKFYDDMMYYTVRMGNRPYEPFIKPTDGPDAGYSHYEKEDYGSSFHYAIYRIPMDGSGGSEYLTEGFFDYGNINIPYQIAKGKLYYIPYEERYLGKLDYVLPVYITGKPEEDAKKLKNQRCLSYLYAPNNGTICELDLKTKETKTISVADNAFVFSIDDITDEQIVLHTISTDIEMMRENYSGRYRYSDTYANIIALELD